MSTNFYELLGVDPGASADEIKRAFRREIAKYHPDKVQHLGQEFQEIAAVRSAELTRAYKTLTDDASRVEYDEAATPVPSAPPQPPPPAVPKEDDPPAASRPSTADRPPARPARSPDNAGASDLVRRAAVVRFRQAVNEEFGRCDDAPVRGFEIACAPSKGRFWSRTPPRILARFVPHVDAAAIAESWGLATRTQRSDQREMCVFVMGPLVAPVGELARAIADEMRKPSAAKVAVVPVNTRTWSADIPKDAPAAVKTLVAKLKAL